MSVFSRLPRTIWRKWRRVKLIRSAAMANSSCSTCFGGLWKCFLWFHFRVKSIYIKKIQNHVWRVPFFWSLLFLWATKKFLLLNSEESQNCLCIATEAQKEGVGRPICILTPSSVLQDRWWWAVCAWTKLIPCDKILHKLLQCVSFSHAAVFQELLHPGSFPTGCSPSGMDCSQPSHR